MGESQTGAAPAKIQDMTEVSKEVLEIATDAFDNEEKALRWLHEPNIQLDNQPPISMIGTPEGLRAVKIVLNQIKYAIFA